MPFWAQLIWCGLFVLLSRPPRAIGRRGAALITAIVGVPLRLWAILVTVGTLWMLVGIAWVVVGAFYVLTALWIFYLWLLYRDRGRTPPLLTKWMARLAALEGAAALNSAAGALIALFSSGITLSIYQPVIALVFAIAQVVYLHRASQKS